MKKYLLILLAIVLTACTAAPTPTPTATATFTPPASPTPTLTPTVTPDPNMPEGATGRNKSGEWIKDVTAGGNKLTYTWSTEPEGWFASHILDGNLNGGIPLIDQKADGWTKTIPLYFYLEEGVRGPYLRHQSFQRSSMAPTFTHRFITELLQRHFGSKWTTAPTKDRVAFNLDLLAGNVPFSFSTPSAEYEWKPGPTVGYKFMVVSWDNADPAEHPEFNVSRSKLGPSNPEFRWMVFLDAMGMLVAVSATQDPESLTDNQFMDWIFNPLAVVLENEKILPSYVYWSAGHEGLTQAALLSGPVNFTIQTGKGTPAADTIPPHFEIVRDP